MRKLFLLGVMFLVLVLGAQAICCEKAINGTYCSDVDSRNKCDDDYGIFNNRCSDVSVCEPVCCVLEDRCDANVVRVRCVNDLNGMAADGESSCGVYSPIEECEVGCCNIGDVECSLRIGRNCELRAEDFGYGENYSFIPSIGNINVCKRECGGEGCCYVSNGVCHSGVKSECQGIFYQNTFCSLKPECACRHHASKECFNGDVYWVDSCGNREEIANDCDISRGTICSPTELKCITASCGNLSFLDTECKTDLDNNGDPYNFGDINLLYQCYYNKKILLPDCDDPTSEVGRERICLRERDVSFCRDNNYLDCGNCHSDDKCDASECSSLGDCMLIEKWSGNSVIKSCVPKYRPGDNFICGNCEQDREAIRSTSVNNCYKSDHLVKIPNEDIYGNLNVDRGRLVKGSDGDIVDSDLDSFVMYQDGESKGAKVITATIDLEFSEDKLISGILIEPHFERTGSGGESPKAQYLEILSIKVNGKSVYSGKDKFYCSTSSGSVCTNPQNLNKQPIKFCTVKGNNVEIKVKNPKRADKDTDCGLSGCDDLYTYVLGIREIQVFEENPCSEIECRQEGDCIYSTDNECLRIQAPQEGNCNNCNLFDSCTKYRCNSLGQNCRFSDEMLYCGNIGDNRAPRISLVRTDLDARNISYSCGTSNSCFIQNAPLSLQLKLATDEAAKCRYTLNDPGVDYSGMSGDLNSNLDLKFKEHSIKLRDMNLEYGEEYDIYVGCEDSVGNKNTVSENFKATVKTSTEASTDSPEIIFVTDPIYALSDSYDLNVYVNERANCVYSSGLYADEIYNISCSGTRVGGNGTFKNYYLCTGEVDLSDLEYGEEETVYVSCTDLDNNVGSNQVRIIKASGGAPVISYIYRDNGILNVYTNKYATCKYSYEKPNSLTDTIFKPFEGLCDEGLSCDVGYKHFTSGEDMEDNTVYIVCNALGEVSTQVLKYVFE